MPMPIDSLFDAHHHGLWLVAPVYSVLFVIGDTVKAIAWPVTVSAIVFAFRAEIKGLLARVASLQVGGARAEFANYPTEISFQGRGDSTPVEASPGIVQAQPPSPPPISFGGVDFSGEEAAMVRELLELSRNDPLQAIVRTWSLLSAEAIRTLRRVDSIAITGATWAPVEVVEHELLACGALDRIELSVLQSLRTSVDRSVESRTPPGPGEAVRYISQALPLRMKLQRFKAAKT